MPSTSDPPSPSGAGEAATPADQRSPEQLPTPADQPAGFRLGQEVRLARPLPFLRSADPMPMLRPPDLVDLQEIGVVQEVRSLGRLVVRFRRGAFLIDVTALESVSHD